MLAVDRAVMSGKQCFESVIASCHRCSILVPELIAVGYEIVVWRGSRGEY